MGYNSKYSSGSADSLNVVAGNIRRFREEKGWTQEKLGVMLGVSNSYISMLEHGHKSPNLTMLYKIANVLDCNAFDLLAPPPSDNKGGL